MLRRMKRAIRSRLKSLIKSEKGVTAIEFAFIAPVALLLMGIMLESGLMAFTEFVLQSGVQRAARDVKIGVAQDKPYDLAAMKKRICTLAGVIINCDSIYLYLKPGADFSTLYAATPDPLTVGPSYNGGGPVQSFDCGSPRSPVVMIATYDWKFSIPYFMKPLGNVNGDKTRRLVGLTTFQNEPFPTTKKCS